MIYKYVFFREYFGKPICIGHYASDNIAFNEAVKLSRDLDCGVRFARVLSGLDGELIRSAQLPLEEMEK